MVLKVGAFKEWKQANRSENNNLVHKPTLINARNDSDKAFHHLKEYKHDASAFFGKVTRTKFQDWINILGEEKYVGQLRKECCIRDPSKGCNFEETNEYAEEYGWKPTQKLLCEATVAEGLTCKYETKPGVSCRPGDNY